MAADDSRADAVINQIYSAGLLLRSASSQLDGDEAALLINQAVAELDVALHLIRRAAYTPRTDRPWK
jgi:hypothetical protein